MIYALVYFFGAIGLFALLLAAIPACVGRSAADWIDPPPDNDNEQP